MWNPIGRSPKPFGTCSIVRRTFNIRAVSQAMSPVSGKCTSCVTSFSELVKFIPEGNRSHPAVKDLAEYGCKTQMHVVRLLAPRLDNENHTKDVDFSRNGVRQRWEAGYANTMRSLERAAWDNDVIRSKALVFVIRRPTLCRHANEPGNAGKRHAMSCGQGCGPSRTRYLWLNSRFGNAGPWDGVIIFAGQRIGGVRSRGHSSCASAASRLCSAPCRTSFAVRRPHHIQKTSSHAR